MFDAINRKTTPHGECVGGGGHVDVGEWPESTDLSCGGVAKEDAIRGVPVIETVGDGAAVLTHTVHVCRLRERGERVKRWQD